MKSAQSRYELLRQAFCEVPVKIGPFVLRPVSGASFELLGELRNPLVFGDASRENLTIQTLLAAVLEYIWIHSADLETIIAIRGREDIPKDDIRRMGLQIELGEALAFTSIFTAAALRMAAAIAEPDDEDEAPGKPESLRTGSPASLSLLEPPEIQSASDTCSGSLPSSAPSPTCTPPTCNTEPDADGATPLMTLPDLETTPPA